MAKTISSSELRAQIKRVLNEVGYGQSQYVVERFYEPTAATASLEDLCLLQVARRRQATSSPRELAIILPALLSQADVTPGQLCLRGITLDPKDDAIVACAKEGGEDYVASGD
jgi:hypothetical protein